MVLLSGKLERIWMQKIARFQSAVTARVDLFLETIRPREVTSFREIYNDLVALEERLPSNPDWNRQLCVDDIGFVKQRTTCVSVEFDDESVADFYEDQVDRGREPFEFSRIWIHTHPGESAEPSLTDEETFARCFGECDWAVMFILAKYGEFYARIQLRSDANVTFLIPVEIDYRCDFRGTDREEWDREYQENVQPELEWYQFDENDFGQMTSEEQKFLDAYYRGDDFSREEIVEYERYLESIC